MRTLVSATALFLFAGSLYGYLFAQDTVGSKKFRINFRVAEKTDNVEPVELWVTKDGGRTWVPSGKAGVRITWGSYKKGSITANVTVPDEGSYGFYAQLKDKLSNESAPPAPGQRPRTRVKVVTNYAPAWIFPEKGNVLQGGEKTRLRWSCPAEFFQPDSVTIEFEFGNRFMVLSTGLPINGDHFWKVTPYTTDTSTRLRLTAKDKKGRTHKSILPVKIRKVPPRIIGKVEWLSPRNGTTLDAGNETVLKWSCSLGAFERNSVTLESRTVTGDWKVLADHLPLIHGYKWRAPKNRKEVEFRLSAKEPQGRVRSSKVRFQIRAPVIQVSEYPKWISPTIGTEVLAGSEIDLQWSCSSESYSPDSVSLQYMMYGKREQIRSVLPLSDSLKWPVPNVPGRIRLQVSAMDRMGEVKSSYVDVMVTRIDPVLALKWISPLPKSRLEGGSRIQLKWVVAPEYFRPDSVSLSYIVAGKEVPVRKGMSLSNDMEWTVPSTPGPVRLQLSAVDKTNRVRSSTTDIWVQVVNLADHLKWISPVAGGTLLAGSRIKLKWACTENLFRKSSASLSYLVGGRENSIGGRLPLSGEIEWTVPNTAGPLRLRLTALDETGQERSGYNDVRVQAIRIADHMRWISPVDESRVAPNSRIMLKWSCSEEFFQANSVSLKYILGGVEKSIGDGFRLSGHLEWVSPRIGGPLRIQLTARDQAGQLRHLYTDLHVRSAAVVKQTRPEWILPKDGSYLISGQHTILQWKVPANRFRPRTVRLSVSTDGVDYQPLAQNRPLSGTYQWRIPPLTQDRRMWFRLQAETNMGTTEPAVSKVMVRFIPPIAKPKPRWVYPKTGDELKGGERVTLQWLASVRDFQANSASIDYSFDGSARMSLSGGLSVTGDYAWRVPKQEGNLSLYVRAKDRFGIERESTVRVIIREPRIRMITRPEWIQPTGGDELIADVLTPLRWRTMAGDYRQNSVTLSYSVDGSPWQPIVRGQRLTGTYLWRAPRDGGVRVSLRLTAERTDNSAQQTDTGPFTLANKKREGLLVRWVQPSEGESLPADGKVVLRWSCPTKGFQPGSVVLSASTDGGNTWDPIEQKRPLEGEHVWHVTAPPGSDVTLRASALETNGREREAFVYTKVIQSMAIRPEWLQPGSGDEVPAGAAKILRWHTPKEGFQPDSVSIFASVDGGPEDLVGKVLPLSGSLWYQIPDEEGGRLRLRLVAQTVKGRMVAAILEELRIKTSAQKLLSWIHPRDSAAWKGGDTTQLQWTSLRGDLREKSAHLYYSVDGGNWTLVTRGLDPAAFYFWTVPWRNGAQLRLKVSARTRGGTAVEAVSPVMTVEATMRPDIAMAKRHADRARIYAAQNRTAQASQEYEKALAIWSDYPEALNDLGAVYSREKQYAKALEFFLRAKMAAPSSPVAYVNAAAMEIQLGLGGDALEDLRDAVELGVDQNHRLALQASERLWQLAKLYQISGEMERSEEACGLILRIRNADRRLRRQAEAALTGSGGQ